jgi:peptidylprolyl isomerase
VANEKRQRQDQNRQTKVVQQQTEAQKSKATKQRKKLLTYGAVVVAAIALGTLLSQCGGGDEAADDTVVTTDATESTVTTKPAPPTTLPAAIATKPVVSVPAGEKPTKLVITDLVVGKGPEIAKGDNAEMNYVGVAWSTKKEFDASWNRSSTFLVENVGSAPVIDGWNQGLVGMKEGGRRQLVIPGNLGYGAQGSPPDIGADETLVFVIDAVKVTKAGAK